MVVVMKDELTETILEHYRYNCPELIDEITPWKAKLVCARCEEECVVVSNMYYTFNGDEWGSNVRTYYIGDHKFKSDSWEDMNRMRGVMAGAMCCPHCGLEGEVEFIVIKKGHQWGVKGKQHPTKAIQTRTVYLEPKQYERHWFFWKRELPRKCVVETKVAGEEEEKMKKFLANASIVGSLTEQ